MRIYSNKWIKIEKKKIIKHKYNLNKNTNVCIMHHNLTFILNNNNKKLSKF